MDVELIPEQPPEVESAVVEALGGAVEALDPWWQAGLEEALET